MVKRKVVSFATAVALWTLITFLLKLIRMLLKWQYIHCKNYAILAAMIRKRSYFVKKVSSQSPGLECSYGKIFIPVTEISVTGPARPLIWTHRNFYEGKSGEAKSRKPSQPGWPGSYEEALRDRDSYFTFPLLFGVASKYVNSTLDHCHSRSLVVTTRVKVGCSPAITRSAI